MVITGAQSDKKEYSCVYFMNDFHNQYKQMPKYLNFTVAEIPYLCFCYANGFIKGDYAEYQDGNIVIKTEAVDYRKITDCFD